jgi:uncharacterized OB-fold protein
VSGVRAIVRVAAYAPIGSAAGRRVAAPDEDSFTLGATALERAWSERPSSGEPIALHLLGDFPTMADWGFPTLVGTAAEIVRHPGTARELARTLRSLEEADGGPALVVAADLPERGARPPGDGARGGAAAVAYLLEPSESSPGDRPEHEGTNRSAVAAALEDGGDRLAGAHAETYVGDWAVTPGSGRPVDLPALRKATERDLSLVSEGAYVPRARYLENLPSRWRLRADECGVCHELTFPARGICRRCRRRDQLVSRALPRDGVRVMALTTIGKGGQPTEFDAQVEASGPYGVALVEFAPGTLGTLQVTDAAPGEVKVGDTVNTQLRRLYPMEGEWRYGRKAVPLRSSELPARAI